MNYIDLVIAALLILYGISGYLRGFIRSFISLAGLVAAIYLGFRLSIPVATLIHSFTGFAPEILTAISFVLILVLIVVFASVIANKLHDLFVRSSLGFINRLMGLIFGLVKGGLILSLLVVLISWTDPDGNFLSLNDRKQSRWYYPIENIASDLLKGLKKYFPDEWDFQRKNRNGEKSEEHLVEEMQCTSSHSRTAFILKLPEAF